MSAEKLLDRNKLVWGLAPSADRYDGNPVTDFVQLAKYDVATFLLMAVATTGTAVATVEASAVAAGTSPTAIAGRYRKLDIAGSPADALAAETAFAAAGFTTGTSESAVYAVEVRAEDLPAGKPFVGLRLTEGVNAPVIGSVLIALDGARYRAESLPTAIS